MMKTKNVSSGCRFLILCLVGAIAFAACSVPTPPAQPLAPPSPNGLGTFEASPLETPLSSLMVTPAAVGTPVTQESGEASQVVKIKVSSQAPESEVTVKVSATPSITTSRELSETVSADEEPVILTGMSIDQKCGHGDVVAVDGHSLRASPHILTDNSNFYERLPEGTQVDLIDCRFWTNREQQTWVAVRTAEGKLGWMLVQPDSIYITIYPIALTPPTALTGIPAGTTVAYVPPSEDSSASPPRAAVATSIGIDFIPVVGDLKGLAEVATGYDLITGESLGDWRWLGLLGVVGLAEVALLRHGDEVADGLRMTDNLDEGLRYGDEVALGLGRNVDNLDEGLRYGDELAAGIGRSSDNLDDGLRHGDELALGVGRNADNATDLLKGASRLDDAVDGSADTARAIRAESSLADEAALVAAKFEQPCSFSPDTPVSTPSGLVPISRIKPGDLVLAYHEPLDAVGYYTVTAVFAHVDPGIVTLAIGADEVETTPEHPFYVRGEWVPARALVAGDSIVSASSAVGHVYSALTEHRPQVMYNLTVADAHTYFVGAGEWLVHNACSRILRRNLKGSVPADWTDGTVEWQAHHVIPAQLEDHDFVRKAIDDGKWNIDGPGNGVALPLSDADAARLGMPAHRGPHGQYTSGVEAELNQLQARALAAEAGGNSWSAQRYVDELNKLVGRKTQEILSRSGRLK